VLQGRQPRTRGNTPCGRRAAAAIDRGDKNRFRIALILISDVVWGVRALTCATNQENAVDGSFEFSLPCQPHAAATLAEYIKSENSWFHQFQFDNGLRTPGRDPSAKKLHHLCLPRSLRGKSVIDVGAYEGFFSFHCEARGAERVVACDRFVWDAPGSSALPNVNAIHAAIGSRVERLPCSVPELPAATSEKFDIVLFLGVLYHAPDMIRYLEAVAGVVGGVLVLETYADSLDAEGAAAAVYAEGEMNNDPTNWFGPNLRAIEIMLRRVGFKHVEFINFWDVNTRDQMEGRSMWNRVRSGRLVVHAYR
jgi:tRNA (mo5U34)-methyltransferase